MSALENAKTYTGKNLETIFFRPMLSGPSAIDLGVRVLYNMPVPTTVQMWEPKTDILQKFTAAGWSGGAGSKKLQKTIPLNRVKAELGYSAADYFSLVYELITNRPEVNMEDLTGTELEEAETTLFKQAIAESIRSTMWVGDTSAEHLRRLSQNHRHLLEQQQGLYLQLRNGRHEHTGQLGRHVRRSLEKCGRTPERP